MKIINIFKKGLIVGVFSIVAVTFAACGGGNGSVVGAWDTDDGHTMVFESDGTVADTQGNMTYKVSGNNITFYINDNGALTEVKGTISGNAMTIKNINGEDSMHLYKK